MGKTSEDSSCMSDKNSNNNIGIAVGLKKGPWTPEEDRKLLSYIHQFGHGSWRSLPSKAGLKRCGKSCRLRWTNYLRPGIKRGRFSLQEERTIIQLHALLGNRWSTIAAHLPRRTDNEIKNYWNSHIKKRLMKMGVDPMTHKPKSNCTLLDSNLSHMAQWEAARLEAEARLVQKPKHSPQSYHSYKLPQLMSPPSTHELHNPTSTTIPQPFLPCLDVLKVWEKTLWSNASYGCLQSYLNSISNSSQKSLQTPATPMANLVQSQGGPDQGRLTDHIESPMAFEELLYPYDSNFCFEDQLRSPGLYEGFLGFPVDGLNNNDNREGSNGEDYFEVQDTC